MKHLENTMIASQPVSRNYEEPPTPAGPGRRASSQQTGEPVITHTSLYHRERGSVSAQGRAAFQLLCTWEN